VIKRNLIIRFAFETNGTEPPMCMVTEPWICRLRYLAPDCKRRVKHSDIMCWIYSLMQPIWYKHIICELVTNEILIFKIQKIIIVLFSMLPSCSVILPNPPRNIIIYSIPFKFSLTVKFIKNNSIISIK